MKTSLALLSFLLVLAAIGCSAGETTQSQIEKDAAAIQTDPDATPVDSGASVAPMDKGGN